MTIIVIFITVIIIFVSTLYPKSLKCINLEIEPSNFLLKCRTFIVNLYILLFRLVDIYYAHQ